MKHTINLNTWDDVTNYIDWHLVVRPSYFERVVQGNYPKDAFSKGQLASKAWLLEELGKVKGKMMHHDKRIVAILGCWVGTLVEYLHEQYQLERIYGIDLDPAAVELAEHFNQRYVQDSWKFKGVVADVSALDTKHMQFETGGELIDVSPCIVINTSCEHMDTHWFDTASTGQLIVMQTNNSPQYEGHINTCESIEDMANKYPLDRVLFSGELVTPAYTRFMQIGYK